VRFSSGSPTAVPLEVLDDFGRVEGENAEFGRLPADEGVDEKHVFGLPAGQGVVSLSCGVGDRDAGVDLESGAGPWREGAGGPDSAAADEECLPPAESEAGRDQAGVQCAEPFEAAELPEDAFERVDAVAEAGRFFVAEALGEVGEALPKPGRRSDVEQVLELCRGHARERAGGERGLRRLPIGPNSVGARVTTNSSPRRPR
jgi:hypothetical protein